MYACLYILEIWNVKLYDYPELILIFYRLVTFKNLLNTLPSHYVDSYWLCSYGDDGDVQSPVLEMSLVAHHTYT